MHNPVPGPLVFEAKNVFIVGCGDIGLRVARLWQDAGVPCTGLARSEGSAARLRTNGFTAVAGDLDEPASLTDLPVRDALVYYFAPPPGAGTRDTRMAHLLAASGDRNLPARLVYLSTTGVYGDCAGAWVSETTPLNPQTDRARRRADAEAQVRDWAQAHAVPWILLRVPGIYGPGRLPEKRLRDGSPVLEPAACGYTNRIHAHDLARVCVAAATHGTSGDVFNVSDGQPGTMTEYFFAVADALGLPRPPVISLTQAQEQLSPAMLSYLLESRRIDNRRLRKDLGVSLCYPTLAAGLAASVEAGADPAEAG